MHSRAPQTPMTPGASQQGFALLTAILLIAIIMAMLTATLSMTMGGLRNTGAEQKKNQAFYVAQSGMSRALARARDFKIEGSESLPASVNTNQAAGEWLAQRLNGMSGQLPSGRFTVVATSSTPAATVAVPKPPATVTLISRGWSPRDRSLRVVRTQFDVTVTLPNDQPDPMIGAAPAALTITGSSSINGAAPIAGVTGGLGNTHNMSCPPALAAGAACVKSGSSPNRYTMNYSGTVPSSFVLGKVVRPTTVGPGQRSEERYIVSKIDGNSVTMTVLSDYIDEVNGYSQRTFPATGTIAMREVNSMPALLMPPGAEFTSMSNNVQNVCATYSCEHYTMSSADLFKATMGGEPAEIEAKFQSLQNSGAIGEVYSSSTTVGCESRLRWVKLGSGSSVNIKECNPPQMVIVDGRNSNGSSLDINIPSQDTFRGMLYVMAKPGTQIKMTGNVGYAGALIADNGAAGIDMTGNGNFNEDCAAETVTDGLKKTPKLCYDDDILVQTRETYLNAIIRKRKVEYNVSASNWSEIAEPGQ